LRPHCPDFQIFVSPYDQFYSLCHYGFQSCHYSLTSHSSLTREHLS
jgi:hypothetical protein